MTRRRWWWLAAAVLATAAAITATVAVVELVTSSRGSDEAPVTPTSSASGTCAGTAAEVIDLDTQVVDPDPHLCFTVSEPAEVTVGAAALDTADDIALSLVDEAGGQIGEARSTAVSDPAITVVLGPGTYFIEISDHDGATPGAFLVYTATFDPVHSSADPDLSVTLPSTDQCGETLPWLEADRPITVSSDRALACLEVSADEFVTIGAVTPADAADDLDVQLALFSDINGVATLVRSVDDTFGLDPEMSIDLAEGIYLVEIASWFEVDFDDVEVYYHPAGRHQRQGQVAAAHMTLDPEVCTTSPHLEVGSLLTIEGEQSYLCLDLADPQRLTVEAATLTDQDLAIELIGWDDAHTPFRIGWTDDNPHTQLFADFDPLLDQVVPAGQWVVAVTDYTGAPASDFDVRVALSEPQVWSP